MKWKGYGRQWWWPNLRYYASICLEGWRKTMRNLSQDSQFPGQCLKMEPPMYGAGVLTTLPQYLAPVMQFIDRQSSSL
jgi:hypothetical protein